MTPLAPPDGLLTRLRRDWRGETYFGYWLGLPWRCKLFGHKIVERSEYMDDYCVESWSECERCQYFAGHR